MLMALSAFRRLHDRIRPSNHVVQIGAGRHHRIDRVFLLDPEVQKDRAAILPRGFHRRDDGGSVRIVSARIPNAPASLAKSGFKSGVAA